MHCQQFVNSFTLSEQTFTSQKKNATMQCTIACEHFHERNFNFTKKQSNHVYLNSSWYFSDESNWDIIVEDSSNSTVDQADTSFKASSQAVLIQNYFLIMRVLRVLRHSREML